ncbi:563_t:CDS:1, partial [Acaulospora colombiana]
KASEKAVKRQHVPIQFLSKSPSRVAPPWAGPPVKRGANGGLGWSLNQDRPY